MSKSPAWIVRRRPAPAARLRLYCFAYAGGSAASFAEWHSALPAEIDVCALQLPGRGARYGEPAMTSMPELVDALGRALAPMDSVPCVFFGHSLGALVAFELARHWASRGVGELRGLIVSGARAPSMRGDSTRKLHLLNDAGLIAALGEYKGTPPELLAHAELMALVLPTIRADFALSEGYVYRESPLAIPVAAFSGRDDEFITGEQVDGWRFETRGTCDIHWFEGDHFFINPLREAVLGKIVRQLSRWNLL
jgi:surfactin synthase thioesterase subunit